MTKKFSKLDLDYLQQILPMDTIDNDFILLDDIRQVPFFDYPVTFDLTVATICLNGYLECSINMKQYQFTPNSFFVVLPGQILQYSHLSDDFSGLFLVLSRQFTDNLEFDIRDFAQVFLHLREHPSTPLNPQEMELLLDYHKILKKTVQMSGNINRREIVRLLIQAFFYGVNDILRQHAQSVNLNKLRSEALFNTFYELVLIHYADSREIGFYADKLHLTPKYLSSVIKNVTGKTAAEWINDYVVLQAKAMLKSTGLTIQEISDRLNFTNQSFFGKYFKQHTGMSPSAYRNAK
jgi:AraC-like DNA-binding protein